MHQAGKITVAGFYVLSYLWPGISDIYRSKGLQRGLSGLYRCCKVSTATKDSLPDAMLFPALGCWAWHGGHSL